jgi:hemoglobin
LWLSRERIRNVSYNASSDRIRTTPRERRNEESVRTCRGNAALHHLEEIFYTKVLADPVLKSLFTERRPHHVDHLTWFTAESFGGRDRFTRELGFQHIIDAHRHLQISDDQRERFVALYMETLDDAGLPDDEPLREAVRSDIEFGARVAQQNSWAETDADLSPIRNVPRWQRPATSS